MAATPKRYTNVDEVLYNPLLQAVSTISCLRDGPFMKICIKAVSINLILMKN